MTETAVPSYEEKLRELRKQLEQTLPADKLAVFDQDATQLGKAYPLALPLKVGMAAPGFVLPDAREQPMQLQDMLQRGAVVLTFYRGAWCPYCNLQLRAYAQILPQLSEAGAQLVAISPMTPDKSFDMASSNTLEFVVLSDIGNNVARQYTTVIINPKSSIDAMTELGFDFFSYYGDDLAELPLPATYVIAQDGTILFAGSQGGDYRKRVEPREILAALGK